ncbi:hypothetical protein FB451DRAFT_1189973 [Mycena latifolia]|nr:hypothetical protein FB451DRAFT_1189973 [Mycena latifolia]
MHNERGRETRFGVAEKRRAQKFATYPARRAGCRFRKEYLWFGLESKDSRENSPAAVRCGNAESADRKFFRWKDFLQMQEKTRLPSEATDSLTLSLEKSKWLWSRANEAGVTTSSRAWRSGAHLRGLGARGNALLRKSSSDAGAGGGSGRAGTALVNVFLCCMDTRLEWQTKLSTMKYTNSNSTEICMYSPIHPLSTSSDTDTDTDTDAGYTYTRTKLNLNGGLGNRDRTGRGKGGVKRPPHGV